MKNIFKYYLLYFITLLICALLSSLILTILNTFDVVNFSNTLIISIIISYVFSIIASFIMGLKLKRHGIIHGFIISTIFMLLTLIFNGFNLELITLVKISIRSLLIVFFTILGVNKSK